MKAIFTFTCLFIVSLLFAQTSFRTALSTSARNDDNEIFKVIQLSDGSYVGVGTKNANGNQPAILVVKLNASGAVTSSKVITNANASLDDEGISIIATTDGGFAVSGTLDDLMTIIKLDASLTPVWQKQYTTSTYTSQGTRLIQTSDGGYIIVGALYNDDDSSASYLVKTDSQGTVSFSKQYSDFTNNGINDITATKDGNYALLMGNNNDDFTDTSGLVKIKPDGSILWSRHVNTDSLGNLSFSVIQASDGGYVTAGYVDYLLTQIFSIGGFSDTFSIPLPQVMMNKFDASGALLWSKKVTSPDVPLGLAYSVLEDKDGGYIFSGIYYNIDTSFQSSEDTSYAYLIKLNANGTLQWTKALNQSTTDNDVSSSTFTELARTSDGGIVVAGAGYQPTDSDFSSRGVIYKFNSSYDICGVIRNAGSIINAGIGANSNITVSDVNSTGTGVTVTTTSSVTGFDLCNLLPLQLLSFNATLQNKSVNIEWKTANEVNTNYFAVERSSNTNSFTALQKVTAKGNSSSVQTYTTTDLQPMFGTSYYRLKEVDKDGKTTYSNIVPVTVTASGTLVISPNPVHDNIRVLLQSAASSSLRLQVTDMAGKTLVTQSTKVNAGTNTIIIPASSLSKGLYVLKVIGNSTTQSIKFVKE